MPIETVSYTITPSGGSPRTGSISVNTSGTGAGTGSIVDIGTLAGVDSIQATISRIGLTSNAVNVAWQATNGPIAVTPVSAYVNTANYNANFPSGLTVGSFSAVATGLSGLMFNTFPQSLFSGDPHANGNQTNPIVSNIVTSAGGYGGDQGIASYPSLVCLTGNFVVAAAGNLNLTAVLNSTCIIAIQGASYVSGRQGFNGMITTPIKGYSPLLGDSGLTGPPMVYPYNQTDNFVVNFPAAGVYPFEICFASGASQCQFDLFYGSGSLILPVASTIVPAPPGVSTGDLVLTPTSQGPYVVGSSATINVQVQGISYNTRPYLGLLEGSSGYVFLTNSTSSGSDFVLPSFNGASPTNPPPGMLNITGDNGSYSGKLSFTYPVSGSVGLYYNGSSSDPSVASTNITITQDDLAWYRSGFADMFQVTSQGGGQSYEIEVDWLVNPGIGATPNVSPTSVVADGRPWTFTIYLVKPLPPLQNGTTCLLTFDSHFGSAVVTATPMRGGTENAWIMGWTAVATPVLNASSTVVSNLNVSISAVGLTYLQGTSFVTPSSYTYYGGNIPITVVSVTVLNRAGTTYPNSASLTYNTSQYEYNNFHGGNALRTKGGVGGGTVTDYIRAYGFGLGVPSNATIYGVQANVDWQGQNAGDGILTGVALFYRGSIIGTAKNPGLHNQNSPTVVGFGGGNDMWEATLTPAIVNDSSFGVGFQVTTVDNGTTRSFFYYFSVTVSYFV